GRVLGLQRAQAGRQLEAEAEVRVAEGRVLRRGERRQRGQQAEGERSHAEGPGERADRSGWRVRPTARPWSGEAPRLQSPAVSATVTLLIAYAAGCVSFAALAGRLKGVDVRKHGSGNPGATNVGRVLGRAWGAAVLVLDILKGLLPTLLLAVPPSALDP